MAEKPGRRDGPRRVHRYVLLVPPAFRESDADYCTCGLLDNGWTMGDYNQLDLSDKTMGLREWPGDRAISS